jgi:cysteine-rich repeat protein
MLTGTFSYAPRETTTLIADAHKAGAGDTLAFVMLRVDVAPMILGFTASSSVVRVGRPLTVSWRTTNALHGELSSTSLVSPVSIGSDISLGSRRLQFAHAGRTTLTLRAESTLFTAVDTIPLTVLDSASTGVESEPNDNEATANGLFTGPMTVSGVLGPSDVDMLAVDVPRGQRLHAVTSSSGFCMHPIDVDVYAERITAPLGMPLTFASAGCSVVSAEIDPRLASLVPPILLALRHPASDLPSTAPYQLAFSFDRAVCGDGILDLLEECDDGNNANGDGCSALCTIEGLDEMEPNDTFPTANTVRPTISLRGFLDQDDTDIYTFTLAPASAGPATILLESPSSGMCRLDASISLYAGDTTLLAQTDNGGLGCPELRGAVSVLDPGTYFVVVQQGSGSMLPTKGLYRLTITVP